MSIYETVTERILNQMKSGVIPWRKSWSSGLPRSLATGRAYRGINILILASSPFESSYWLTFRQAQQLGGHVRKGERATPVVFWKWRTEEELQQLAKDGKGRGIAPCVPFVFPVFNLEQIGGVDRPADDHRIAPEARHAIADDILGLMPRPPTITHSSTSQPAYLPTEDRITLPHLSQFTSADHYFAVMFHELVHSSGHVSRLDRFRPDGTDLGERYSFEELVAEFGAAFLCAWAGIHNPATEELQASYIDGWAAAFARDSRMLMRAASAAQRAVDYVRGIVPAQGDPAEG